MTDVFFLGDLGGQSELFREVLNSLCGSGWSLPADTTLIQVGDLTRLPPYPGLNNEATLKMARRLLDENGPRYIQLLGNHDLGLLGGALGRANNIEPLEGLVDMWASQTVLLAAAVLRGDKWTFVSHAGLTEGLWRKIGSPKADEAARMINSAVGGDVKNFESPGLLRTSQKSSDPDVTWAEVNEELYLPWIQVGGPPFDLIHGHASPFSWQNSTWWEKTPRSVIERTIVDTTSRRTETNLGPLAGFSSKATSIDWALGNSPTKYAGWPLLRFADVECIVLN